MNDIGDIGLERHGHVVLAELRRPPHNFFDVDLLAALADAFDNLANDADCRAVVLAASGKSFCAGAQLAEKAGSKISGAGRVYDQARRLFRFPKPIVVAVQGAAIGGGLGLAMTGDFRVACPEARFSANFTALGFHPGVRFDRDPAAYHRPTTCRDDVLDQPAHTRRGSPPHGPGRHPWSPRMTCARPLYRSPKRSAVKRRLPSSRPVQPCVSAFTKRFDEALKRELEIQQRLRQTDDFAEGVAAMRDRRTPDFRGQ